MDVAEILEDGSLKLLNFRDEDGQEYTSTGKLLAAVQRDEKFGNGEYQVLTLGKRFVLKVEMVRNVEVIEVGEKGKEGEEEKKEEVSPPESKAESEHSGGEEEPPASGELSGEGEPEPPEGKSEPPEEKPDPGKEEQKDLGLGEDEDLPF